MPTSAYLAIRLPNGKFRYSYCQYDGKPSVALPILAEHYNTDSAVRKLINLGTITSLKPSLGEKHPFDWYVDRYQRLCLCDTNEQREAIRSAYAQFEGQVNALHRDGGYAWEYCQPREVSKIRELYTTRPSTDAGAVSFIYLWNYGHWAVHSARLRREILTTNRLIAA